MVLQSYSICNSYEESSLEASFINANANSRGTRLASVALHPIRNVLLSILYYFHNINIITDGILIVFVIHMRNLHSKLHLLMQMPVPAAPV